VDGMLRFHRTWRVRNGLSMSGVSYSFKFQKSYSRFFHQLSSTLFLLIYIVPGIFFGLTFLMLIGNSAFADGYITFGDEVTHRIKSSPNPVCHKFDIRCKNTLTRIQSGLSLFPGTLSYGLDPNDGNSFFKLEFEVASLDTPLGIFSAGKVQVVPHFSNPKGTRFRFRVFDAKDSFFCKLPDGSVKIPPIGGLLNRCLPGARFAIGFKVLEFQWDTWTDRLITEWLTLEGEYHFLKNGISMDYLRRHVSFILGLDLQTIHYGDLDKRPGVSSGGKTFLQGRVGLQALIRSTDSRWEWKSNLSLKPVSIKKESYETHFKGVLKSHIAYKFLLSNYILGSLGFEAETSYFKRPEDAYGRFASDTDSYSYYIGVFLGIRVGKGL